MPAMLVIVLVTQAPFLVTIYYSLCSWKLTTGGERTFIGLDNYVTVLGDPSFRNAALVTIKMTTGAVLLSFVLGLLLALLVNRQFAGRGVVRTLLITPFLVLPSATALLWKTSMLDASYGIVNFLLKPFGVGAVDWVSQHPLLSVIVILSWQWTPFFMLILLAGLQSEDPNTVAAAKVDGAGPLQIFRYLTASHLRPYAELSIFLGAVYILQSFDVVYMVKGGPGNATTNLPYYLYLEAFRGFDIGQASTLAVLVLLATLVIASFALRVVSSLLREGVSR